MPTIKAKFTLKDDDIEKVKQAIATCGEYSERAINDYLHNTAGTMIADSITNFIPRSNRDKVHAKDIKWWVQFNYNLAVAIENQTIGRKSTYYLFYPATGSGTSRKKGANPFMERGMEKVHDEIVNGIVNALINKIDKELK